MAFLKFIKRLSVNMVAGANVATILLMLLSGFSGYVSPEHYPYLGVLGLAFPVFAIINIFFMVLWIFLSPKWILLPAAGFLIGYIPIRNYCPINLPKDPPPDAIKVLSFNVHYFSVEYDYGMATHRFGATEYIRENNPDIVCMQEGPYSFHITSFLSKEYPYGDSITVNRDPLGIVSKWPVIKKEPIKYDSRSNGSAAFWVKWKKDTIIVINNHLQGSGLSGKDREEFNEIMHGDQKRSNVKTGSKLIFSKLAESGKRRAPEVDSVMAYIDRHKHYPIILCGDFNESPISYSNYRFSQALTNCYVATGNGPGWSYNGHRMYVRIDNIFCSSHFKPYAAKVDRKSNASDHFPIYCWLKMGSK